MNSASGAASASDILMMDALMENSCIVDAPCFHCGLPVPADTRWQVCIDHVMRPMCCPGCQAVAQSIVESGFADYYATRVGFAASAAGADDDALIPPQLQLYDSDDMASQFSSRDPADAETAEAIFSIEGIRCAACVWLIERRLARLPGLQSATMNVATERLHVRWRKSVCKPSDILKTLREIGYAAYPFDAARHGAQLERARKKMFRQLFIAGFSMMQVMMYAVPVYLANGAGADGTMDADMLSLMRWAGLLLTLPAVLYSAQPFFQGAWLNIKNRMPGMDVPVVLGITAAFIGSVLATLRGDGEVYFDSITMFIFLLLCSRYLELAARRKAASALDDLQHALPASAQRMAGYPQCRDTELVAVTALRAGDVILVRPGDAIAADGTILEGDTSVDLSLLTGESQAQRKAVGADLPGGAVNISQPIALRVSRVARDSTLSVLVHLIERAGQGKPQLALWADRVAAWFVAVLLLFALAVFLLWQWLDPARAWPIAIAVLVVSCPCALSLATPTALAAATDRLLRQGILTVRAHALETLARATHIVFDKTGTLTQGKPELRSLETMGEETSVRCLQLAAALEHASAHPLAVAILRAAHVELAASKEAASALAHFTGQGVEGMVGGVCYRLGNADFVQALTGTPLSMHEIRSDDNGKSSMHDSAATVIYLGSSQNWLARFDLVDALRSDARQVIQYFQAQGKTVMLLSGDQQDISKQVADELGIAAALGGQLPDQKLAYVQALQHQGAIVAMVGDGVNDAAVLRAADVSFAMGSGAALAQTHADCVLPGARLSSLSEAAATAGQTLAVIRQNLAWATLYNLIAIPAAALGWLNPWLSGIGMAFSSAVVVLNALRLRKNGRRPQADDGGESIADEASGRAINTEFSLSAKRGG